MRRLFFAIICLLICSVFSVTAQSVQPAQQPSGESAVVASVPKTDWLVDFRKVKVDGPMNVVLKHVSSADEVRIVYDTKGCITSKFRAEIDKSGVLVVEEKYDPKRTTVTDVTIYYTTLNEVKVAHAKADFEDTIALGNYDIDIHNPEGTGTSHYYFPEGEYYTIPYRSLIPTGVSNMLVAGRCISSDHGAQASYRIMPTVCTIGEAAGVAIGLAVKAQSSVRDISVKELQRILRENGAFLGA